jgi:hypothetical protein
MDFNKPKKLYKFNTLLNKGDIFYGSGGSSNTIIIYKNQVVKLIPDFKKDFNSKLKKLNDQEEIKFYKEFTKELILKNKTPHIVGYYDNKKINFADLLKKNLHKCEKINMETLWEKLNKETISKPSKLTKLLLLITNKFKKNKNMNKTKKYQPLNTNKKTAKLSTNKENLYCNYKKINDKFYNEWNEEIENIFDLTYLELCPTNITKEFSNLLKQKNNLELIQPFINRVVFQFMFTLCAIYEKYPTFIHNDCFLRNILAINYSNYSNNDYIEYVITQNINNKIIETKYYLPANGICIKLNDFGFSFAMPKLGDKLLFKKTENRDLIIDKYNRERGFTTSNKKGKDVWNFLYDLYDGQNFGANSLTEEIRNLKDINKKKKTELLNIVKTEIHKYLDTNIIDKINKNNKDLLSGLWNINNIEELIASYKKPKEYFNNNTFINYTLKPKNSNITNTFSIKI